MEWAWDCIGEIWLNRSLCLLNIWLPIGTVPKMRVKLSKSPTRPTQNSVAHMIRGVSCHIGAWGKYGEKAKLAILQFYLRIVTIGRLNEAYMALAHQEPTRARGALRIFGIAMWRSTPHMWGGILMVIDSHRFASVRWDLRGLVGRIRKVTVNSHH